MGKVGRNDPCPCGSGRKYKRCCAGKLSEIVARETPAPERPPARRTAFVNSVGGVGDAMAIPAFIQYYKGIHPDDQTLLYDSIFFGHYYERPPYLDEIHPAALHFHADRLPRAVLEADPSLPRSGGVAFDQLRPARLVAPHQSFNRTFSPREMVTEMEFDTALADILEDDFQSLGLRLKPEGEKKVEALINRVNPDGRPLAGLAIRAGAPRGALSIPPLEYLREMERLASELADRMGARVLLTGDERLRDHERYQSGDWIDLDDLTPILFHKLEIMRRCDLFLGAPCGFWEAVNLLRGPSDAPALQVYGGGDLYDGRLRPTHRNYITIGGRHDLALVMATFRNPALRDFVLDRPHTTEKILDFASIVRNHSETPSATGKEGGS